MRVEVQTGKLAEPSTVMRVYRGLLSGLLPLAQYEARSLPPLYESGVLYEREEEGTETLAVPSLVHSRGYGDCGHLALWRLAELRNVGETGAQFHFKAVRKSRPRLFHVLIRRADGTLEDPSRILGM